MMELIDRQSALEIAMCYCPDDDGSCSKAGHDIREMLDEIEELPAIESEVHHGYWKAIMMSEATGWDLSLTGYCDEICEHVCSVCGKAAFIGETGSEILSCFCPQCGTDMREEVSEDA